MGQQRLDEYIPPRDTPWRRLPAEEEAVGLVAAVAAGRREALGIGAEDAFGLAARFASLQPPLTGRPLRRAVEALLVRHRCARMAEALGTFEQTQEDPAFSPGAMEGLRALLAGRAEGGEAGLREAWEALRREGPAGAWPVVTREGGPGDAEEAALRMASAPDHRTAVWASYWHLYHTFGRRWERGAQALYGGARPGSAYDIVRVHFPEGAERDFFFDVTEWCGGK